VTESADHRATVCLSFDFDAVSIWMALGAKGLRAMSRGEFGARVGAPRILDLLKRYEITSTWFIPGHTAETYPEITARVADEGHEIGNHGYCHEAFDRYSVDELRSIIKKANEALTRITGQQPEGMRAPLGDPDGRFLELLVEEGFTYDSSLHDGEYDVYWARGLDTLREDGPNIPGPRLDLVEIAHSQMMQDFAYFETHLTSQPWLWGSSTPSQVEEIWRTQFDYMYERVPGGILRHTLHPQSIGWGGRIMVLERFIEHCLEVGTRFTTYATIAREFREKEEAAEAAAAVGVTSAP
jgi:peptidoglycan-N-acetylglucosamine deacetylase